MTRWVCIDGEKTWLETQDVGSGALIRLNAVIYGSDVLSVNPAGQVSHNQNNGSWETFTVLGDFVFVTPTANQPSYGFRWIPA